MVREEIVEDDGWLACWLAMSNAIAACASVGAYVFAPVESVCVPAMSWVTRRENACCESILRR